MGRRRGSAGREATEVDGSRGTGRRPTPAPRSAAAAPAVAVAAPPAVAVAAPRPLPLALGAAHAVDRVLELAHDELADAVVADLAARGHDGGEDRRDQEHEGDVLDGALAARLAGGGGQAPRTAHDDEQAPRQ